MATDKTLICRDCGNPFLFSAGEQEFYQSKGFSEPVRCPACRATRKANRPDASMPTLGSSQPRPYAPLNSGTPMVRSDDRFGPRPERQLYTVVCDNCGEQTTVPFKPIQGKPVYCRACYAMMRA